MLRKEITTVLFDLDGTLLPMKLEAFTSAYFSLLAKQAAPFGYDPKALADAVWKGTRAMQGNDGTMPNCDRFWQVFGEELGPEAAGLRPEFDRFYANEFHQARGAVGENPLAGKVVRGLRDRGYGVALATNPLFPAVGVETRLSWLGLSLDDFSLVTTYENSRYCKPNPRYYKEILDKMGRLPQECLMVGNDAQEDLAARDVGLAVYLVTDCLENPGGRDLSDVDRGSFPELAAWMGIG